MHHTEGSQIIQIKHTKLHNIAYRKKNDKTQKVSHQSTDDIGLLAGNYLAPQ